MEVSTAAMPENPKRNNSEAKQQQLIESMGYEAFLLSFKQYLNTTDLNEKQKSAKYQALRFRTIVSIQKNYLYN